MQEIIILGAGGTGREVMEICEDIFGENPNYRIKGFLSDVLDVLENFDVPYPMLGTIKDYKVQPEDKFILAIGDVAGRRKVAESILERGGKFLTLIHPSAQVYRSAKIGEGVLIMPHAFVGANADVGNFCFINCHAGCGHDVKLGKFSEMAPYSAVAGGSKVGEECFFALHAVVAPKTVLGNRVVVSQGSTIQKNQPDDKLIIGVPGKSFRKIGNF